MTLEEQLEGVRTELAKYEQVRDLVSHEGWKIVVDHFNKTMAVIQKQLTQETDYQKIVRLQERHRAFEAMLQTVDSMYRLCDNYRDKMKEIQADVEMKEQYALNT